MADQAKIANIRAMAKQAAEKSGRRHLKSVSSRLPGNTAVDDGLQSRATTTRPNNPAQTKGASQHETAGRAGNAAQRATASDAARIDSLNLYEGHEQTPDGYRDALQNIRQRQPQNQQRTQGAAEQTSAGDESNSMVPVDIRGNTDTASRDLQAINDAVNLAERERHELGLMQESKLFSDRQLDQLGIVHPRSRNRPVVDSIRQLRTKLFSLRKTGNFSVLVSSVVPGGGSSFIAMNLAATIAFDQTKTSLLLDANLQNPFLHKMLRLIGRKNARGLVDFLESPSIGVESIVHPSGIPRLRIVPAGSPQRYSEEHLSSQLCNKLMMDIQQRYSNRYIVVDGPAISGSADASVLADLCDFLVLVVPYGSVTPGYLDSLIDEIDETKLAGIVLNDQPE